MVWSCWFITDTKWAWNLNLISRLNDSPFISIHSNVDKKKNMQWLAMKTTQKWQYPVKVSVNRQTPDKHLFEETKKKRRKFFVVYQFTCESRIFAFAHQCVQWTTQIEPKHHRTNNIVCVCFSGYDVIQHNTPFNLLADDNISLSGKSTWSDRKLRFSLNPSRER